MYALQCLTSIPHPLCPSHPLWLIPICFPVFGLLLLLVQMHITRRGEALAEGAPWPRGMPEVVGFFDGQGPLEFWSEFSNLRRILDS